MMLEQGTPFVVQEHKARENQGNTCDSENCTV
jgi:hypothetical protein